MEIESRMRDSILLLGSEQIMKKKIEILSPAGSYDSLKAAIAAGADAVYVGGNRFGARAYADNLSEDQLLEAIDYVHLHGRKLYLTINTLLKEKELKEDLYNYLLPYYRQGLDAVIVQDMGVLRFVREQFPDLPVHASTQMTITNVLGAKLLEELGVERVVTARELQLGEIREIAENTHLEIESFVHGALCYCYSGQCLYSSLIGGRSGNRGQCAQPCRLPYKVGDGKETQYVLSLKDICTLEYIPQLMEAGINSFKIEGRMKKPEYVALVTAMYRKYVDLYLAKGKEGFSVSLKDRQQLMDLYNRGGFHSGYYETKNGREMVSLTRPNHAGVPALRVVRIDGKRVTAIALTDIHKGDVIELPDGKENYTFADSINENQKVTFVTHKKQFFNKDQVLNRIRNEQLLEMIRTTIIEKNPKENISGRCMLSLTEPARLILSYGEIKVEVTGETAQEALTQPMDATRIQKQLCKTGNTEFQFKELDVILQGNLFIPMQSLNELRRKGIEALKEKILSSYRRKMPEKIAYLETKAENNSAPHLYVYVEQWEQWETALVASSVQRIYVDSNMLEDIWKTTGLTELLQRTHQKGKEIYLGMPHIFRADTIRKYTSSSSQIFDADWDGMLVRNYESYQFLKELGYKKPIVTDHNLYLFNQYAKAFWRKEGVESTTAPLELNVKELAELGLEYSELIVYGYLPMMISAGCIQKTTAGCNKQKQTLFLKDRYQKKFAVKNFCDACYNVIYNTLPVVLTDQKMEILSLKPKALRMHFTTETGDVVRDMIHLYDDIFLQGGEPKEPDIEFTRGHFKRGIK